MKVILTEKVKSLGNIGEIVNVSPGHARNFLFPRKLGLFANEKNQRVLENQKRALGKKIQEEKKEAIGIKKKLDGLEIVLTKKVGANGKLFGTVTSSEVSKELAKREIGVERRLLVIETPIKSVGAFTIKAKIFQDVVSEFQVKVEMDPKQLEELQNKSKAAPKKKKEEVSADSKEKEQTEEKDQTDSEEQAQSGLDSETGEE